MSIQHHPGEAFLLDYASGALSEAWSIAIATHLAMCPECRRAVSGIETIGAGLMESLESVPLSPSSLATLMDRINEEVPPTGAVENDDDAHPSKYRLPQPLPGYVANASGENQWQRPGRRPSPAASFPPRCALPPRTRICGTNLGGLNRHHARQQ